ncbi:hypothetical protein NL108_017544 [Boleophthalmus pectinirostris]|nr:hypothetical protein NL108_017544 [Boleophthalmus pectinirostris]
MSHQYLFMLNVLNMHIFQLFTILNTSLWPSASSVFRYVALDEKSLDTPVLDQSHCSLCFQTPPLTLPFSPPEPTSLSPLVLQTLPLTLPFSPPEPTPHSPL